MYWVPPILAFIFVLSIQPHYATSCLSNNQEQECQSYRRTRGHIMQLCVDSPCREGITGLWRDLPSYRYAARHINSLGYMGDLFPPELIEFKGATERKATEQPIQL